VPDEGGAAPPAGGSELSVHYIDVGQGDSTLVLCPNGNTMLIDGGSLSGHTPQRLRDYLVPRLAGSGGDIDYLIVSHPDRDHYNLLPRALDEIEVRLAYYVGERDDYNLTGAFDWIVGEPARSVRLSAADFDRQSTPNASIDCGAADVWILAAATPATIANHRSNAQSIVVMIKMGDFETVITGDATFDTENTILRRYTANWLDIDVLRVGHHGSRATSTQQSWVDTLKPERAIFSAAHRNEHGHPHRDVVTRLAARTEAVPAHRFRDATGSRGNFDFHDHAAYREGMYATAASGTIIVRTDGSGFTLETER
jgi:competence protein ComEC